MKLGIGSYSFPWSVGVQGYPNHYRGVDPLGIARLAAYMNVPVIQLADNLPLHTYDAVVINELHDYCESSGIALEIGTRGIDAGLISNYVNIASKLGAKIIRTLLPSEPEKHDIRNIIDSLSSLAPHLESHGVILAIENYELYSCDEYAEILQALPPQSFGLCLDTANNLGRGEAADKFIDILGSRIVNLHIKDVGARRYESSMGFMIEGVPAGTGIINIPEILYRVQSITPDISVILEQWPPFAESIESTLKQEQHWAELGVVYLKEQIASLVQD